MTTETSVQQRRNERKWSIIVDIRQFVVYWAVAGMQQGIDCF